MEASREARVSADGTAVRVRHLPAPLARRSSSPRSRTSIALFDEAELEYWLFGGWAVDFYAGSITRPHFDVDIAVWLDDLPRIAVLLDEAGWRHAPDPDEDGGTGYERDGVRLELTYLVAARRRTRRHAAADGRGDVARRRVRRRRARAPGVRARLVGLEALTSGKSSPRDDPDDAAKDRADFDVLSGL